MAGVLEPAVRGHGVLQEWSVAVMGTERETERGYTPHKTPSHRCCGNHRSSHTGLMQVLPGHPLADPRSRSSRIQL